MMSKLSGKNTRLDKSSPGQYDPLTLLIVKKIWWSTKNGRECSRTPVFPFSGDVKLREEREQSLYLFEDQHKKK
jgi:hypothetical protein